MIKISQSTASLVVPSYLIKLMQCSYKPRATEHCSSRREKAWAQEVGGPSLFDDCLESYTCALSYGISSFFLLLLPIFLVPSRCAVECVHAISNIRTSGRAHPSFSIDMCTDTNIYGSWMGRCGSKDLGVGYDRPPLVILLKQ